MEKELLLLGLLQRKNMHGYQLFEHLKQNLAAGIHLKKANIYKILKRMQIDGLVNSYTEQPSNRPPRQVYSITPNGTERLYAQLKQTILTAVKPEIPYVVALNFLYELPEDDVIELLEQRLTSIKEHVQQLGNIPFHAMRSHPGYNYLYEYYVFQSQWLRRYILSLSIKKHVIEDLVEDDFFNLEWVV